MKTLLDTPEPAAAAAVRHYCYRISRELGSLAAALGGLDALVFTGGIGEHAAPVRAQVCRAAAWLGIELDEAGMTPAARASPAGGAAPPPGGSRPTSRASSRAIPSRRSGSEVPVLARLLRGNALIHALYAKYSPESQYLLPRIVAGSWRPRGSQ
jgi:hypothetical protein